MAYWWCLEHKQVEEGLGCASTTRVGPYDTPAQAQGVMERLGKREAEQQAKDKAAEQKWGKK